MRLTTIILIATFMQVSAGTFAQKLTLHNSNIALKQVFKEIRKQTGYDVLYQPDKIDDNLKLKASFDNTPIEEVLNQILQKQSLDYTIKEKTIIITPKTSPSILERIIDRFDNIDVHGKVLDEQGSPMIGATVSIIGGPATKTDQNGEFDFKDVDEKARIRISYVGYRDYETTAKRKISIQMVLISSDLQEVVVNKGYYSTTRKLNTGSVSRVEASEITKQPVSDPIMALEGRVSGLYIAQQSGIPGSGMKVRLRGQNSLANGNDPLYIVDGMPYSSQTLSTTYFANATGNPANNLALGVNQGLSPFNNLNPADIESIEVLKDADATAIYGSRGANGVILITTKKGRPGKTKFDISAYSGAGEVTNKIKLLNTQQYLEMRNEAFKNDNRTPGANDNDVNGNWNNLGYTDWQKELIGGTARFTNLQASVSGGGTNTQYSLGGGYSKQTTVYPGDYNDQKGSFNANITHRSEDGKFNAQFTSSFVNDNNLLPATDFTTNIKLAPTAPALYDQNGNLNWQNGTFVNPLAATKIKSTAASENLIANLNLSYLLLKGLTIKANLGFNRSDLAQTNITPATAFSPPSFTTDRVYYYGTTKLKSWIAEPQISYQRRIYKGDLDILVGTSFQESTRTSMGQQAKDFPSDALLENPTAASVKTFLGNDYTQYRYTAVFARIGYNLKEKYLINITGRRDGSSRFGEENKFGNFGAIGAGWIFSEENFLKNTQSFLSFGKLRMSYGITGNDQITDYQYLSSYSSNGISQYQGVASLYPTRIPNPYYGWESVKKFELGLETSFFHNRLAFNINYYSAKTGNQLVGYTLPSFTGFQSVQYNLPAVVRNSGLELELSSTNILQPEFKWTTIFNITVPANKLLSYPNLATSSNKNKYIIGESIFIRKYLEYTGVDQQTGLYTVRDVNSDNKILSPDDYVINKNLSQKYFGGIQNTLTYKGIEFGFFFQFVKQLGSDYLTQFSSVWGNVNQNLPVEALERWQKPGDEARFQKYSTLTGTANTAFGYYKNSDANLTDASFIRLKNVSLSYTLPSQWTKALHINQLRLFLLGQNVLTFTPYKGLDPETQSLGLPPLKMFSAGAHISL